MATIILSANEATTKSGSIEYVHATITLPPDPDVGYDEYLPYHPEQRTYEMMIAGDTGLAYMQESIHEDLAYTVIHLPSARFLNIDWFVETERLARQWIAWLVLLADWTEPEPQIRQGMLFETLALASAGMLVDPELEDDPGAFNPVEQLRFASAQDAA